MLRRSPRWRQRSIRDDGEDRPRSPRGRASLRHSFLLREQRWTVLFGLRSARDHHDSSPPFGPIQTSLTPKAFSLLTAFKGLFPNYHAKSHLYHFGDISNPKDKWARMVPASASSSFGSWIARILSMTLNSIGIGGRTCRSSHDNWGKMNSLCKN